MDALHSHIQGEGKWEISARSPTGFQTHTQVPPNEMYTDTHVCACMLSLQSCLTLCDPMDCSPQGSSVHGILQARIREWVSMSSSRGSSRSRDQAHISCISHTAGRVFTAEPSGKPTDTHTHGQPHTYSLTDTPVTHTFMNTTQSQCAGVRTHTHTHTHRHYTDNMLKMVQGRLLLFWLFVSSHRWLRW